MFLFVLGLLVGWLWHPAWADVITAPLKDKVLTPIFDKIKGVFNKKQ